MQRGFSLILVLIGIIAVVALVGGVFYVGRLTAPQPQNQTSQPSQSTSTSQLSSSPQSLSGEQQTPIDWGVYSNTKVGFQISYPSSFSKPVLPSGLGPEIAYANGSEDNIEIIFNTKQPSYGLTVFPFTGTLADILSERKVRYVKSDQLIPVTFPDIPLKLVKTSTISNVTANWYTNGNESGTSNTTNEIHFIGKGHGFIFRSNGENPNLQEMQQIISTFEFTR